MVKHLCSAMLQEVWIRWVCVCLYKMCVVPQMSLSEEARWVRWSRSMNCRTCSPPLAGSQRTMGSLAMFSEGNKIIRLWSLRRLFLNVNTWIWFTDFTLTSISIWTKAAQTNAMAANNMPTVILFKGLEHKTDSHNITFIIHRILITLSAGMPRDKSFPIM